VLDENAAQRRRSRNDLGPHFRTDEIEPNANQAELHDFARRLQHEQNLADVNIAFKTVFEDADIDGGAVMLFDGHRHMVRVNEEFLIRSRHLGGRKNFVSSQEIRRRKHVEQGGKVGHDANLKPRGSVVIIEDRAGGCQFEKEKMHEVAGFDMALAGIREETFCPQGG
jgi:hypothetical protein